MLGIDTSLPPAAEEFAGGDAFCPASALGAQQVHQPQPLVALVFLGAFILYYFVNWKYLSTGWGLS